MTQSPFNGCSAVTAWKYKRPPSSARRIHTAAAVNVDKVVAGKIVEHGGAANMLEPFLEVGAIREAGR